MHDGPTGGHYGSDIAAQKILQVGYYWPTLIKDAPDYAKKRKICQTTSGKERNGDWIS